MGASLGTVVGWFYFTGAATAQTLVALAGTAYLGLSRAATIARVSAHGVPAVSVLTWLCGDDPGAAEAVAGRVGD